MSGYTGPDRRRDAYPMPSPSRRLWEMTQKLLERQPARDQKPSFSVDRVKGVGGQTVIEWHVGVPVCDEFPTAAEAHKASMRFAAEYEEEYGVPDELLKELEDSVREQKAARVRAVKAGEARARGATHD